MAMTIYISVGILLSVACFLGIRSWLRVMVIWIFLGFQTALTIFVPVAKAVDAAFATTAGKALASNKTAVRALLNYHCGVSTLRTRQMMRDLQAL